MASLSGALFAGCVLAALVLFIKAERSSPCPDLFHYEKGDQPQQWVGTLNLQSDDDLNGVWIRVKFDAPIKEINVEDNFGEVVPRSPKNDEFLIKNPQFVLKARNSANVRITVKYDGNKVPSLIGYRLNAKTVCPEQNTDPTDVFRNDANSQDFLSSVLYKPTASSKKQEYECGLVSPKATEHPWQAAIFLTQGDKEQYVCEGTLITPSHLLTAAHCVTYQETAVRLAPTLLNVYFGKTDLNNEVKPRQRLNVASIDVYPGYKYSNSFNDIAIVELISPAVIDDFVRPICLGNGLNADNKRNIVVGYHLDKGINIGSKLISEEVKEINADECEKRIPELSPLIGDNTLCASYKSDNSRCVGDSGSSVASLRAAKNAWELRAIVTLGVALQNKYVCNQSSTVLLADVSKYLKWIKATAL